MFCVLFTLLSLSLGSSFYFALIFSFYSSYLSFLSFSVLLNSFSDSSQRNYHTPNVRNVRHDNVGEVLHDDFCVMKIMTILLNCCEFVALVENVAENVINVLSNYQYL